MRPPAAGSPSEQPENQREQQRNQQAGAEWEKEGEVFPLYANVSRQPAEKMKLAAEDEQQANPNQQQPRNNQAFAEIMSHQFFLLGW